MTTETNETNQATEVREQAGIVPWCREARKVVLAEAACAVFLAGMAMAEMITGLYALAVGLWAVATAYAAAAGVGAVTLPREQGDRR